jgi:peroxiredoxin
VFTTGIGLNLVRGRRPLCHCFGQLSSGPIGGRVLARNGALAAGAGFVVLQGLDASSTSALSWAGGLTLVEGVGLAAGAAVVLLLLAEAWLLVQLWRLIGRLLLRIDDLEARLTAGGTLAPPAETIAAPPQEGLPFGAPAPSFRLDGLHGETLTLDALRAAGKPVLLAFMDPACGPCNALLPDLGRWQREPAAAFAIAIVSRGTPDENRHKSAEHGLTHVLLQQDREVAEAYRAYGTPSAVLVRPDGTIGSPLVAGADAIRSLVAAAMAAGLPLLPAVLAGTDTDGHGAQQPQNGHGHAERCACGKAKGHAPAEQAEPTARIGQPAPSLRLPGLDGKPVDLATFRGSPTLVLFWNPGCGFCDRMLPELKAWETNRPKGAPKLLVVSTGEAEANRAMGLLSPVVLEPAFGAGRAFGVNGTPSAVLVDAKGRIASEVAVGAPAVMALVSPGADRVPAATA